LPARVAEPERRLGKDSSNAAKPPADGLAKATRPAAGDGGRRRPGKQTGAARLLARLDTHRRQVLRFLDDLNVPFTTNQAERDMGMGKLQQKISGCWRTLAGAEAFLTVRSYISTARKQGLNVLGVLRRVFETNPWIPIPAGT
jgi:transposase